MSEQHEGTQFSFADLLVVYTALDFLWNEGPKVVQGFRESGFDDSATMTEARIADVPELKGRITDMIQRMR